MSPFEALAQAKASGRFRPGVLALLEALAPFAHWGELDGIPRHVAALFPEHERGQVHEQLTTASRVFRKVMDPQEEPSS